MKIPINSMVINHKWRIKKSIFHTQNKLFVQAFNPEDLNTLAIFLLIPYNQFIQQPLLKIIHKIQNKSKENGNSKILVPDKPTIQTFGKCKMFVMKLNQKPISLDFLLKQKIYEFSAIQIIQMAISAVTSLAQLHSYQLIHGKITIKNCYLSNKQPKMQLKKSFKCQLITYFGISITDIEKFASKIYNKNDQIEQLLFQSCSKALGLKISYKDDIESIIYILIRLVTGEQIFSINRYFKQWNSEQQIKKWKVEQLFQQILQKTPECLKILIQILIASQQLSYGQKPNYSDYLRKLWKHRQTLLNQQKQKQSKQTDQTEQIIYQIEKSQNFQKLQYLFDCQKNEIFEQEIKIDIRTEETGFNNLKF